MHYEIVSLEQKDITGLAVRTSNAAPDMGEKIGGLWQRLYGGGVIERIPKRVGNNAYGLYTRYESDVDGAYDVVAGVETRGPQAAGELTAVRIPAGQYAKFSLVVDMQAGGVGAAWAEIWATALDRAYTVDFEEYLPCADMRKAPVNVYIALA